MLPIISNDQARRLAGLKIKNVNSMPVHIAIRMLKIMYSIDAYVYPLWDEREEKRYTYKIFHQDNEIHIEPSQKINPHYYSEDQGEVGLLNHLIDYKLKELNLI